MNILRLVLVLFIAVLIENTYAVECEFCHKDFRHLSKHLWRCKDRINRDENTNLRGTSTDQGIGDFIAVNDPLVNSHENSVQQVSNDYDPNEGNCHHSFQCHCGCYFETLRGLNSHRRACFITEEPILKDMFVITEALVENDPPDPDDITVEQLNKVILLSGVKLPKNIAEWERANEYFKENIDYVTAITNVNQTIINFNELVYNYFCEECGSINDTKESDLDIKYREYSKNALKKALSNLKRVEVLNLREIKFVSHLLRSKLKKSNCENRLYDHNDRIKENYWRYCKNVFENKEVIQPDFDESTCFKFFRQTFKAKNRSRNFDFPEWMKRMHDPSQAFNLEAPTFKEVQKIITKMKSAGSPCPLDHISVLMLKKCAILRTQIWRICCYCWTNKVFPDAWKNATTILIHKKGAATDPSNFRPITLLPVLSKVMTSLIRNRIFTFVANNNYIETNIQKGFWAGLSGTVEHTELLTHIVKQAKTKQRQLVVTLFDLKNAFGEVSHKLIAKCLRYHHVPEEVIELIACQYDNYFISVLTKGYMTSPVNVERGVLQGDSLSPLLFNLIINTLIQSIKNDKVKCLGYVYDIASSPKHWFQFADDTAIVSALEEDNQLLCNVFCKWTTWADLIIRIDKCHTFGIKKTSSKSVQYNPMIIVNRERIPALKEGESLIYLGKQFNFGMNIENIKEDLITDNISYITKIDQLPLLPLNKLSIVQGYVFSKYRWIFTIYDLTETWIVQNIDSLLGKYVRKWFQLPISSNIEHLALPLHKLGINYKSAKTVYVKSKLSVRRILRQSKNEEISRLYNLTSAKNVRADTLVNATIQANPDLENKQISAKIDRTFNKSTTENIWNSFMNLKEQNCIIKHITINCSSKIINMWQSLLKKLPGNIFAFSRKALIFCLPNKSNLYRWKKVENNECSFCKKAETQLHVLQNCVQYLVRYTWRHDSILWTLCKKISWSIEEETTKLYADLKCEEFKFPCTSELFESQRPDIVVVKDKKVWVLELTICFETNTQKSRDYKRDRYKRLKDQLKINCDDFEVIYFEVTSLGFISKESAKQVKKLLSELDVNVDRTLYKCMETAIRASYFIFCRRNKEWIETKLLNFY